MAVINSLQQVLPASVILAQRWPPGASVIEDASVVDISDLTPDPLMEARGAAWIEVPLIGADGRITGVLCERAYVDIPMEHPARSENDVTRIYVRDIANLLAVIDGGLRLLDVKRDAEDRATIVERLHRAVERGATLSRRLLDAARPEGQARVPAGHDQVVVDLSRLLDRTLRPDVVVETDIDPNLRAFSADPEQLHLALLNLCKNASDAMPDGGSISITARNMLAHPDRKWVEIVVSDDGVGMPADVLSHMFEPYFTTKEPGKGTGLGLNQVKRFVESCRGTIHIESTETEGTTVRMLFPCT
jgi:signal transduction histidine kinase